MPMAVLIAYFGVLERLSLERSSFYTVWEIQKIYVCPSYVQNHQSKILPLFKADTLKFEFDRHLKHIISYQGMQGRLPMFLVGEFGNFEIFMQK